MSKHSVTSVCTKAQPEPSRVVESMILAFQCRDPLLYLKDKAQFDYKIDAPDVMPAGGCQQTSVHDGEEGIVYMAEQLTCQREGS